jgi:hypothetical protein
MTLSRRSLLKGLAGLAAAMALPLPKVEALAAKRKFDFISQSVNVPKGTYTASVYINKCNGKGWLRLIKHIVHPGGNFTFSVGDLMETWDEMIELGGGDPKYGEAQYVEDEDRLSLFGAQLESETPPRPGLSA